MNYEQARLRADVLKAMAHPVRILLLMELQQGDRCVSDLQQVAELDPSNISRHLALLKRAGIVTEYRVGQRIMHHLECPCVIQAADCVLDVLHSTARRQQKVMKEMLS